MESRKLHRGWTALRPVRCPDCGRGYKLACKMTWWRAESRKISGAPLVQCLDCGQAEEYARVHGGRAEDYRNGEIAPQ